MTTELTRDQIEEILDPDNWPTVNRWLARGDGIAAYQNVEFGHPELGHHQFISFGSKAAMIEQGEPPTNMPDIGGSINWRYRLTGTYRGAPLGGGPVTVPLSGQPDE